jgi:dolichol kinase
MDLFKILILIIIFVLFALLIILVSKLLNRCANHYMNHTTHNRNNPFMISGTLVDNQNVENTGNQIKIIYC